MRARGTKLLAVNTEAALMAEAITLCSHSSRGPEASSQGRGSARDTCIHVGL